MSNILKIGTRKSPLALVQTDILIASLNLAEGSFAKLPISTKGDEWLESPLAELGGKGLFTGELDDAIIRGDIDIAVHSLKDMPTVLPEAISIAAVLPREDVRDCWVGTPIEMLKSGSVVGTSSFRRLVQVKQLRDDIIIKPIRGNVGTRIAKVEKGEFDATILAIAGLKRLDISVENFQTMKIEEMLPAVGQGAIAVVCRASDKKTRSLLAQVNCEATEIATRAERAMLKALDGSCRTPIAGYATLNKKTEELALTGLIADIDGKNIRKTTISETLKNPEILGHKVAEALLALKI